VACDERVERREAGRRIDRSIRGARVAQRADDLVDLADRLARQLLDRLQRRLRALGIPSHAGGTGAQRDHADRVAGGVMEVAGDPGALLGGREATLAFARALRIESALPELRDVRAAQARALAGEPRDGPGEAGVN
jgi:hypothetical protein